MMFRRMAIFLTYGQCQIYATLSLITTADTAPSSRAFWDFLIPSKGRFRVPICFETWLVRGLLPLTFSLA